ncbi:hypothetical protein Y695_02147 [Hydrogenophaga sp. T4]|nr:hypothetical protein Y695_02147 [Hydrogenophaga sp. T4]
MALLATSRMARMRFHLASSASFADGSGEKVSKKIEPWLFSPAKWPQASSAVKLRNGAIQRSMALVIWCSAVWAERRARLLGAVVYRRSFSTSR